ncbi:hypothetical protein ABII15_18250 [Streptomyces sp. HUAS MG91]|uniref:Uncharacterized protein n=1 Tax=Streptomyces tabacisoli TaxID=3156398 RepID=A0AAU8IUQ8_9ACTN
MASSTPLAQAISAELKAIVPEIKTDVIRDLQIQASTTSLQALKLDVSAFKYDEKGLTFFGKPLFPKLSMNYLVQGRQEAKEKAERKKNEEINMAKEAKERAAAEAQEKERVEGFESELRRHVDQARTLSHSAREQADQAKKDATVARNLLSSAHQQSRLAAGSADRASKSFTTLEQRVAQLESRL